MDLLGNIHEAVVGDEGIGSMTVPNMFWADGNEYWLLGWRDPALEDLLQQRLDCLPLCGPLGLSNPTGHVALSLHDVCTWIPAG